MGLYLFALIFCVSPPLVGGDSRNVFKLGSAKSDLEVCFNNNRLYNGAFLFALIFCVLTPPGGVSSRNNFKPESAKSDLEVCFNNRLCKWGFICLLNICVSPPLGGGDTLGNTKLNLEICLNNKGFAGELFVFLIFCVLTPPRGVSTPRKTKLDLGICLNNNGFAGRSLIYFYNKRALQGAIAFIIMGLAEKLYLLIKYGPLFIHYLLISCLPISTPMMEAIISPRVQPLASPRQ